MAKTTSQIVSENKKLRDSLNAIHEKQMEGVKEKSAERTKAVLAKALSGNSGDNQKANIRRSISYVDRKNTVSSGSSSAKKASKTAVDIPVGKRTGPGQITEAAQLRRGIDAAKKNVEQKKKEKEAAEKKVIDWEAGGSKEYWDAVNKKQAEVEAAQAEQNAAVANFDRARIDRMPEEDKEQFRKYVESKDQKNSVFRNDISWFGDYKSQKEAENILKQKYGEEQFGMLADAYAEKIHEEEAAKAAEDAREATEKHPILQNILGAPARVLGSVDAIPARIVDVLTGNENPSVYTPNNYVENYGNAVRDSSVQMIEGEDPSAPRKALSDLYQGATSIADSAFRGMVGGGSVGGALLAAGGTFNQTIADAVSRGATAGQAYSLATAYAIIEYAAEKLPLDNLIEVAKGGGAKTLVAKLAKQAGVEIFEEEATLAGNILLDAAIMQEKSEYNLSVAAYMASGMNEDRAREKANWDLLGKVWETAIISGFSGALGGFSASVAAAFNRGGLDTTQQGAQQAQAAQNQQDVNMEGQAENDGLTDAQRFARDAQRGIEETGAQEAQKVPKAEPEVKSEGLQHFENGVQEVLGMNPPNEQITPKERGLRYKASKVNSAILDMVDRVKKGLTKGSEKVPLGTVSDSNAAQIQRETGIDTKGYEVAIEARQIQHILNRHGENGTANHSMADPNDIARIEYALNNPDRITKSDPTNAYVTVKDGKMKPSDTVLYETRLEDGSYYVVQAVPETKKKTLYVLSAFIGDSNYKTLNEQI